MTNCVINNFMLKITMPLGYSALKPFLINRMLNTRFDDIY